MGKVRRVDFSPDEWLAGALSLKADQRGCYITIIMLIYSHGGAILDDEKELAHACNVTVEKWRTIKAVLLAKDKIVLTGDGRLTNRRCETELEKAVNRTEKARENGQKGGKNSGVSRQNQKGVFREINGLAEADASSGNEANHQLPTTNHKDTPLSPPAGGGSPASGEPTDMGLPDDDPVPIDKRKRGGSPQGESTDRDLLGENPAGTSRRKGGTGAGRGTRVPEGDLPEEWAVAANQTREKHEIPPLNRRVLRLRWDAFANYWRGVAGSKGLKLDWRSTWLNDCISAETEKRFPPDAPAAKARVPMFDTTG